MKKLNLGCAKTYLKDYDNLDYNTYLIPPADIVWDMENIPYPIKDNTYDEVLLAHILEHFVYPLDILEEVYRITKPKGKIIIKVPHWSHYFAYTDVTHKTFFSIKSFMMMDHQAGEEDRLPYYNKRFLFNVEEIKYETNFNFWKPFWNWILNKNAPLTETYLCKIIPIRELVAEMEVIKK